tara:strand:+ start:288 stop:875 length:588 start_codon:yes stop_codon:yes gene_type:complete
MAGLENLFTVETFLSLQDFWLPLLLVFIILYAILQKTKILGEDKKNLNLGISLIIGLLFVIPHITGGYPTGSDPVEILKNAIPQVSLVVVAIVFLLILIGVFGQDSVLLGASMPAWIAIISIVVILIIFGGSAGWWEPTFQQWLLNLFGTESLSVVIMILVFGIIVAFITSDGKAEKTLGERAGIDFSKLFGKKP